MTTGLENDIPTASTPTPTKGEILILTLSNKEGNKRVFLLQDCRLLVDIWCVLDGIDSESKQMRSLLGEVGSTKIIKTKCQAALEHFVQTISINLHQL